MEYRWHKTYKTELEARAVWEALYSLAYAVVMEKQDDLNGSRPFWFVGIRQFPGSVLTPSDVA